MNNTMNLYTMFGIRKVDICILKWRHIAENTIQAGVMKCAQLKRTLRLIALYSDDINLCLTYIINNSTILLCCRKPF